MLAHNKHLVNAGTIATISTTPLSFLVKIILCQDIGFLLMNPTSCYVMFLSYPAPFIFGKTSAL